MTMGRNSLRCERGDAERSKNLAAYAVPVSHCIRCVSILVIFLSGFGAAAQDDGRKETNTLTSYVGVLQRLNQFVLPGGELQVRPIAARSLPIVMRISQVWPHGTDFRYDLEFMALEPGNFDLKDYLMRVDGGSTDDLPSIPVEVKSVLPPGQIIPNPLQPSWLSVGGYRFWFLLGAIVWVLVLIFLIVYRPKRVAVGEELDVKPPTLADLLRPRLEAAAKGDLDSHQLAELERFMIEYWRRDLGWHDLDPMTVVSRLRTHDRAGPLMRQVENWLHNPHKNESPNIGELLKPYENLEMKT
jgi:hypothetical protein